MLLLLLLFNKYQKDDTHYISKSFNAAIFLLTGKKELRKRFQVLPRLFWKTAQLIYIVN